MAAGENFKLDYIPPPTVRRFMADARLRDEDGNLVYMTNVIMGPVGSGKTHGIIVFLFMLACAQAAGPDGVRRSRWAVCRQTLQKLKMTVIKDVLAIFGTEDEGGIAHHNVQDSIITLRWPLRDGTRMVAELLFMPLEDTKDAQRLLSLQLTGAWLSECIEVNVEEVMGPLAGRVGRYPNTAMGGCSWSGILCDTNPPMEGSDWWKKFEVEKPANWSVHKQPSGLDPEAENLEYLKQTPELAALPLYRKDKEGRYLKDEAGQLVPMKDHLERRRAHGQQAYYGPMLNESEAYIDRYVRVRYGIDPAGSAVYRDTFLPSKHVVRDEEGSPIAYEPEPGYPLIVGQDFGRNPWSLITQVDSRGRLRVLREVPGVDTGLIRHLRENLKPTLRQHYPNYSVILIGDPTGRNRSGQGELSDFEILRREGLNHLPWQEVSNGVDERIQAVDVMLTAFDINGPMLLIDAVHCPTLVMALGGQYKFTKRKVSGNTITPPKPDKNHPYSDVVDCLQYVCLKSQGQDVDRLRNRISHRLKIRGQAAPPRPKFSPRAWAGSR